MTKVYKHISVVFVCFLLINGFFITNNFNSTFLVIPLTIIFSALANKNIFITVVELISKKVSIHIIALLLLILATNMLITTYHHAYDLSYVKNIISLIIQLICVVFFIAYILQCRPVLPNNITFSSYIAKIVCITFVIQSLIEIAAFLSVSVASFVHIFYSQEQYEILYESYSGIRGLALTGSPGWGLAVGFSLVFLLYTRYFLLEKASFPVFLLGITLVLGVFFAGRTGFLGIIFSIPLFFLSNIKITQKIKKVFLIVFYSLISFLIGYYLFFDFYLILEEKVFPFVFEMFYKLEHTGKLETGSTNVLIDMWNRNIPDGIELLGTGYFIDPTTGKYYLQTDAGYVRNYLFGGLLWIALIMLLPLYMFICSFKYSRNYLDKLTISLIFLMGAILEIKAMTLSSNKYFFIITLIYMYSLYIDNKTRHEKIQCHNSCL